MTIQYQYTTPWFSDSGTAPSLFCAFYLAKWNGARLDAQILLREQGKDPRKFAWNPQSGWNQTSGDPVKVGIGTDKLTNLPVAIIGNDLIEPEESYRHHEEPTSV